MTNRIDVVRPSAWIVASGAVAQTLTVGAQPPRESRVELSVTPTTATGTIATTGLVNGATTTELATFDGTLGVRQTDKLFTSIAGMTTTGLAGATVSARAVGRDGSPQHGTSAVVSGWPAAIDPGSPSWPNVSGPGKVESDPRDIVVAWSDVWTPRNGDQITDERGEKFVVVGAPKPGGGAIASHWLVKVKRREP